MDAPCPACLSGPSAIDGHPDLLAQTIGYAHLSFKCRRCPSLWARASHADGNFSWTSIDERTSRSPAMGIVVPPRSSSFHPFREAH